MKILEEAINKLNNVYLSEAKERIFIDRKTGDCYRVVNGRFVKMEGGDKGGDKGDKGPKLPNQPKGPKKPQIGKQGNIDIQTIEELLREIQRIKNVLGRIDDEYFDEDESDISGIVEDMLKSSDNLKEKIAELENELAKLKDELRKKGGDPDAVLEDDQLEDDIKEIRSDLDDVLFADDIMKETNDRVRLSRKQVKQGERNAKRAREFAKPATSDVMSYIKRMLAKTLKTEADEEDEESYKKINKKYMDSDLIVPGRITTEIKKTPLLNVYFDTSGSWDESKLRYGREVVDSIMYLEKQGKIKVRLYYFGGTGVSTTEVGGGTPYAPVYAHILHTRPDNIFIMTDGDFDGQNGPAYVDDDGRISGADNPNAKLYTPKRLFVPGVVWQLFKGGQSQWLKDNLRGRKGTFPFLI